MELNQKDLSVGEFKQLQTSPALLSVLASGKYWKKTRDFI